MPGVVHVGFDVALLASNGNATNFPASAKLPPGPFPMFGAGGFSGLDNFCTPCNCPGGPMACDYINPPGSTGTGGATGAGASKSGAGGGAGAAAAGADDGAGCGCRLVAPRASTASNVAVAALLFGIALRARQRRRQRAENLA